MWEYSAASLIVPRIMIVQPIKISWFSPLICSIFGRSHFIVLHSKNCLVNRSKNKSPPTRSTFGLPNRGTINRAPLYNNKFTFILELHQVSYKAIVLLSCVMLLCITVNGRRKEDALKGGSICFNQPPLNRRLHFILWPCHAPSSPPLLSSCSSWYYTGWPKTSPMWLAHDMTIT